MFDFAKLTDFVTGMAHSVLTEGAPGAAQQQLIDVLESSGLDPNALTGLNPEEIATLLSEHGLDPSQFLPAELQEMASGLSQFDLSALSELGR